MTITSIQSSTSSIDRLKLATAILAALLAVLLPLLVADPSPHDDVATQMVGP
jgi:hypothetical protein